MQISGNPRGRDGATVAKGSPQKRLTDHSLGRNGFDLKWLRMDSIAEMGRGMEEIEGATALSREDSGTVPVPSFAA